MAGRVAPSLAKTAADLLGSSLSEDSWRQLESVRRRLKAVANKHNVDMSLPMTEHSVANFVAALAAEGLRAASIATYLGRLTTIHELENLPPPPRSDLAMRLLTGLKHKEKPGRRRLAVSPAILKTLRTELKKRRWGIKRKRVIWAVSCLLWHGSMRSNEVLPRSAREFRPSSTLFPEDITICSDTVEGEAVTFLRVRIKLPKNKTTEFAFAELFEQRNLFFCPVRAYTSYVKLWGGQLSKGAPVMRRADGLGYDRRQFNEDLKAGSDKMLNCLQFEAIL